MKMQNAEMEFVPFDAQDVIATSGDPGSVKGYFSVDTITDGHQTFNDYQYAYKNKGTTQYFPLSDTDYIDMENLGLSLYHIIDSAEYYTDKWNDTNYVLQTTGMNTTPSGSGYKELKDTGDLLKWFQALTSNQ